MKPVTNPDIQGDISNYNKGTIALQKGKLDKALQFFKREKDEFKELYLNIGNAYRLQGNTDEAWKYYLRANTDTVLDLDGLGGAYPEALGNMGLLCYEIGDDVSAAKYFTWCLSIDPLQTTSIWNYSLVMLRDYCSGLELHKHAWKMHEYRFKAVRSIDTLPLWDGVSKFDTIVVLNEQGMGDKIMYGRYLSMLASYGNVVVQCPVEMEYFFSAYKCVRTIEGYTLGIPFGALPEIFGQVSGKWLTGLRTEMPSFNICVEWAGSKTHLNDRNRSCYAGYFSALGKRLKSRGIVLHNVRPDSDAVKYVTKHKTNSWSDSCTIINSCDLVVSVDTSLVHVAGSLGVDTLMIQPTRDTDFRWGNPVTKVITGMPVDSNIWYDSVKVVDNLGWEKVFVEIERLILEKHKAWWIKQVLGGYTIEEFIANVENNK
jgi:hypothetical protein